MVLPSPLASRGPSRADEESESLAVIFEHGIRPGSDVGPEGEDEDVGSRPGKPAPPLSSRGSIMSFSVSPRPSQQIEDSGVDVSRPPPIAITALEESNRWRPSALRSPRSTVREDHLSSGAKQQHAEMLNVILCRPSSLHRESSLAMHINGWLSRDHVLVVSALIL